MITASGSSLPDNLCMLPLIGMFLHDWGEWYYLGPMGRLRYCKNCGKKQGQGEIRRFVR